MEKVSFSDGLAISGLILAIVLVVLDKAAKLKGPLLYGLLAVAACMALPLVFSLPWVCNAPAGIPLYARRMLTFFIVGVIYSVLAVWISVDEIPLPAPHQASSFATTHPITSLPAPHAKNRRHDVPIIRHVAPATSVTVNNAPNGFAVSGGTLINPIINNGPPPRLIRHLNLSDGDKRKLVEYLREAPGKVELEAFIGNSEAYEFSREWGDLLSAAGWEVLYNNTIHFFTFSGPEWTGVLLGYHGERAGADGTLITIETNTPLGHLANAITATKTGDVIFGPSPSNTDGIIVLQVGPSGEVKPKQP